MSKRTDNERFEVELNKGGGKISTSGKGSSRLIHAAADIVSPLSQGLGVIGDEISRFRIYREVAAAKAFERMKQIKQERGENIRPISPKLLAPWLEGASSEDIDAENITEMWARILAASPEMFDSTVAAYIDICKHIGKEEADLLQQLIDIQFLNFAKSNFEFRERFIKDGFRITLGAKLQHVADNKPDVALEELINEIEIEPRDGVIFLKIIHTDTTGSIFHPTCDEKTRASLEILSREGLAKFDMVEYSRGPISVTINYAHGTQLAYSFFRHVYPEKIPKN